LVKRSFLAGIRRGIASRQYVALAATSLAADPIWKKAVHCNLTVIALPEPFPVHGMPPFPEHAPQE
jgi:hypothetical protein